VHVWGKRTTPVGTSKDNSNESTMALEQEIPEPLVRAAQRGDEAALARLLEAVRPQVQRWALIQTGSPDDAEDIVQEALLRAVRALGSFNHAARITTWLHTIVRSTAADWHRTRKRREALLRQRTAAPAVARQPEPAGPLLDVVRGSLGTLPARQREVFDLIDLQGYSPAEAAHLLDMNATTVRVHLLRARRRLRTRILEMHPHMVEDVR
jgi:RNA polymerase sigma-70 factor (ECF subfamily)